MRMRNLILMRTLDVTGPSLVNGATFGKRSSNQEKQKKTFFPSVINIKGLMPVMNSKIDSSG